MKPSRKERHCNYVFMLLWTQAMVGVLLACCLGAWEDFVQSQMIVFETINGQRVHVSGWIPWAHQYWINRLGNCSLPYLAVCLWIANSEYFVRFGSLLRLIRIKASLRQGGW